MSGTAPETTGFARQLAALKQRGCTVLVESDAGCGPAVCEALLGSPGLDRRHVFVPTTASVADVLARRDETGRDPDRLGVVDASGAARGGVAVASPGPAAIDRDAAWYSRVETLSDLSMLLMDVEIQLSRVAPADPGPGEVRFCLDSLDPFVDAVDRSALFRFLHVLAGLVRGAGAVGHVHVAPGTLTDVSDLRPVFDAHLEARMEADGSCRQRWTLHESGVETDWLPVDDAGAPCE